MGDASRRESGMHSEQRSPGSSPCALPCFDDIGKCTVGAHPALVGLSSALRAVLVDDQGLPMVQQISRVGQQLQGTTRLTQREQNECEQLVRMTGASKCSPQTGHLNAESRKASERSVNCSGASSSLTCSNSEPFPLAIELKFASLRGMKQSDATASNSQLATASLSAQVSRQSLGRLKGCFVY